MPLYSHYLLNTYARSPLVWISIIASFSLVLTFNWAYGARSYAEIVFANHGYTNSVLDFERIFVLGMPSRTDKRDSLSLSASLTNIRVEFEDGVDPTTATISPKAIPETWNFNKFGNKTFATWRAHMNMLQKVVREQIQSALIMEDDVDWDVNIKNQLVEFAHGSRYILDQEEKATFSPYGDGWDVLWIGHCGAQNGEIDQRYWVTTDDPTAVPQSLWVERNNMPNFGPPALNGKYTRAVFKPVHALCSWGYAVSLKGAQRLLYDQTLKNAMPLDAAKRRFCDEYEGICIAPYPTLMFTHEAAGSVDKDSDRKEGGSKEIREKAKTNMIVFSARLNLQELINDKQDNVKSQWPEQTMLREMDGAEPLDIPKGKGVWITKDELNGYPKPT